MSFPDPLPDPKDPLQDRFELAVETAASRAAQRVARIHRMRLVRWTFLAAMLTTLSVILILWIAWIGPSQRDFSRKTSLYACNLTTVESTAISDFVNNEIQLRQVQQNNPIQRALVRDFRKLIPIQDLQASINQNNQQVKDITDKWNKDARELAKLAGTQCVNHIG